MVIDGLVDASAIDSTVLELELEMRPHLAGVVRVIHTLGPSPIPPAVVSPAVPPAIRHKLRRVLLAMHDDPGGREVLARAGIARFASVSDACYDAIRQMARFATGVELNGRAKRRQMPALSSCKRAAAS